MNSYWKHQHWPAALIVLLTIVAYLPAIGGGFVFDDKILITQNQLVKAGNGLYRFWLTTEAPDYYPLTWSLWWLEWRTWGANPMGYHVVNVLLHAANAVLVWMILLRLKIPAAWLAATVFAVHPVNVATVAWISEQKNTLSMLFYATTILLYLRFKEEGLWRWYGLSLTAFVLALLSKTAVVMLPIVLLGCVWWSRGRLRAKDFLCSVPFFVLSLALGLVTVWFQYNRVLEETAVRTDGFLPRLVTAGWVPWFYLYKALLPFDLTVIYPKWNINTSLWSSYLPGVALVGCLTLFWWKRNAWGRPLLFAVGYFVVTLFPVLGFLDQGFYTYSYVADHWQYYAIVGAIVLVVAGGDGICRRMGKRGRDAETLAGIIIIVLLGAASWRRCGVYSDNATLWQDNVRRNPSAWMAHYNLGMAQDSAGRFQEAIAHFEQAVRIKPDYAYAHNNLGIALMNMGKIQDSIVHYAQAVRIDPNWAEAHNNLAVALALTGKFDGAISHYEQALRIYPEYAEAHYNFGSVLLKVDKIQDAIGHYEQAVRLKSDFSDAHYYLGVALEQAGRAQEAIGHYKQALRIKPDFAEAQRTLARLRAAP